MNTVRDRFLVLHVPGRPLLMPNAWDVGSARCLAALGFEAIGTSSSAIAATFGVSDGALMTEHAYQSAVSIAAATPIPVSAYTENGYADSPEAVAALVSRSVDAGLAGISLEDWPRDRSRPPYTLAEASRRVAAAVDAAAGRLVVTARADRALRSSSGDADLSDIIARLQAYEAAGADVLFAPGVIEPAALRTVLAEISKPLSVMWMAGAPSVRELSDMGAARISLGPFLMYAAYGTLGSVRKIFEGTEAKGFWDAASAGGQLLRRGRGEI